MAILISHAISHKLKRAIGYATNPEKTEQKLYVSTINCHSVETACEEMQATKKRWNKTDGILCFSYIQSFMPDEVTPDLAHKIGLEFAKRAFPDYEVVIGTHLDRKNLHNHFILNSVNAMNGRKYHTNRQHLMELRKLNDSICREYGLSVIEPNSKGKHYSEWKAEQENKPTIRGLIKADIDEVIKQSYSLYTFWELLRDKGYSIKKEDVTHIAIKPPYSQKYMRLRSLGDGYDIEKLTKKIENSISKPSPIKFEIRNYNGNFNHLKPAKKYKGLVALYWRMGYMMGRVKKNPSRYPYVDKKTVIEIDKIFARREFLEKYKIETNEQLASFFNGKQFEISLLEAQRKKVNLLERREPSEQNKAKIAEYSQSLKAIRKEKNMAKSIMERIPQMRQELQKIKEMEVNEIGYGRTNGRPSR